MRFLPRRSLPGSIACVFLALVALAGSPGLDAQDVAPGNEAPLSQAERESVVTLERALGSRDPRERDRAAEAVRAGPGARAASFLLDLAEREPDAEARFRARALVQSLLMRKFLAVPCGPAWLGVSYTPACTANHEVAIRCDEVIPGGPADRAGFKAGELVVLIDGQPFRDGHDLRNVIHGIPPGTEVAITVDRDGQDVVLHPVLGRFHDANGTLAPPEHDRQRDIAWWRFHHWLASRAPARELAAGVPSSR